MTVVSRPLAALPSVPRPGYALGFGLYIVLNAILFIRPSEVVPDLMGFELYQACIIPCLLLSFPVLLYQLAPRELETRPITCCVLGFALIVTVTNIVHSADVDFLGSTFDIYK